MTSVHKSRDVRILKKQCTSLAKAGYEVYLVAGGESFTENGVQVVGVGEFSGGRLQRMTKKAKIVYQKALALDCDIYQIHDPELLPYGLKLKKKGKTVVFDSHEDIVGQIKGKSYLNKHIRLFVSSIMDCYLKKMINKFDYIITVTPNVVDYYKRITTKVVMITNFPIFIEASPNDSKNKNTIVFAGGVSNGWSVDCITKSIQDIDVRFSVCGPCEISFQELIKELDKNKKVDYKGILPHEQALQMIRSSTIGMAIAEYSENAGGKEGTMGNTKLFEYMLQEIPVICTDFILWENIITKYDCGICVTPENTTQIAEAITYLLEHPDIAKEMGQNGRRAVLEEFNWSIEEKKLFHLYEELSQ